MSKVKGIEIAGNKRVLDLNPDFPDLRDRLYEPPLIPLLENQMPPENLIILDQQHEGACCGFALAAALNLLKQQEQSLDAQNGASPRMLYEMARLHDEWPGKDYPGSSVRGAIKGFFHNGVCREQDAPYKSNDQNWSLTVSQAKSAHNISLGSYYRIKPKMVHYHAALKQSGVIIGSAKLHSGWARPTRSGRIKRTTKKLGGHAFAIVGYDAEGFLVQNSWGPDWSEFKGRKGVAHWPYHDWAESIVDAWVLRLAVPTPEAFELTHTVSGSVSNTRRKTSKHKPRRQNVIGHILHIDDGNLVNEGRYGTPMRSIEETAKLLHQGAQKDKRKYMHLLFYAHGGVTDAVGAARKTAAMREGFKRNGIYPIHFIWETGLIEEMGDILRGVMEREKGRASGFPDYLNMIIEKIAAKGGRSLWREMKADATRAFKTNSESAVAVASLLAANEGLEIPYKIHLIGHSAGSNFVGEFINQWSKLAPNNLKVENCFVIAPACTVKQYNNHLVPALKKGTLGKLTTYNLSEERELADSVSVYSRSLLYLVSAVFEKAPNEPLLGMEKFSRSLPDILGHEILYAGKDKKRTDGQTHGGYGADLTTMNDILKLVLGNDYRRSKAFRKEEVALA